MAASSTRKEKAEFQYRVTEVQVFVEEYSYEGSLGRTPDTNTSVVFLPTEVSSTLLHRAIIFLYLQSPMLKRRVRTDLADPMLEYNCKLIDLLDQREATEDVNELDLSTASADNLDLDCDVNLRSSFLRNVLPKDMSGKCPVLEGGLDIPSTGEDTQSEFVGDEYVDWVQL
ncbi:hypothetical protein C8R41DRAFT_870892 [Lentinula lateritia]|uniref:Uncharacterized protein n=1 Tax=Lentinula lateritia TaxID=40482 RepID=A0ABQ8V2T2_9AGAR|nr:hypothetical protein C8R41DRAFT_870892 [Lentinula lateritia]